MQTENTVIEYKSLQKIRTGDKGFKDLAQTCVCLANAQGGRLIIGIEDKTKEPITDQIVTDEEVNTTLTRLRSLTYSVGLAQPQILTHENGGQYFEFRVLPSMKAIATTSDGKIYLRIADQCHAARSEDIHRLAVEKDAFQWELVTHNKLQIGQVNPQEITALIGYLRQSPKVKASVKEKSDVEILEHYLLVTEGYMTNLGVLWLGTAQQRARIAYPITVQYLVFDENGQKVRKETWHDYTFNPQDLLRDIESKAIELTYFHEFPNGLFRKQVRHYPPEVIRELLVNAFVHKQYTISSDITIEVYPDRMTVTNAGGLPMGITKSNILHEKHRRNPHLINIFHDLGLMEGEGSGYDLIYEKLSRDAKPFPTIESDFNKVSVTVYSKVIDEEILQLLAYVQSNYPLTSREIITFGIVSRHKKLLSTQLSTELQLADEDRLRNWLGKLLDRQILISRGMKKGTSYLVNPKILEEAKLNLKPTLKTIEPHVLRQLILEDLKVNPNSSINDVFERLRKEVPKREIRKEMYELFDKGEVGKNAPSKYGTVYFLAKKK
jgi:ATP-dependent DNA helicase RecG